MSQAEASVAEAAPVSELTQKEEIITSKNELEMSSVKVTALSDEIKAAVQLVVNGQPDISKEKNDVDNSIKPPGADSVHSLDPIDTEINSINEANQIKNSEESSNYEDFEDSSSPFQIKQIKNEQVNDKKDNTNQGGNFEDYKNNVEEEVEDDDDYEDDDEYDDDDDEEEEDEEEELDEFHEDDPDCNENIEVQEKLTDAEKNQNVQKKDDSSNQVTTVSNQTELAKGSNELENKSPEKLSDKRLNRQTSLTSNNSPTTPIDPALAPVKKGQFYEHDNRDDDEDDNQKNEDETTTTVTTTSSSRKNSIDQSRKTGLPNVKPHKLETSTSGSNELLDDGRWSHDMYEKQEKREIKSSSRDKGPNSRPRNNTRSKNESIQPNPSSRQKSLFSANQKPRYSKPRRNINSTTSAAPKNLEESLPMKSEANEQTVESNRQDQGPVKNESKGLSLHEYLGQEASNQIKGTIETTETKPKRKPNMQTYQPHQRFSNNTDNQNRSVNKETKKVSQLNESGDRRRPNSNNNNSNNNNNITGDLQKRLDFSTRKPINASNFVEENSENNIDYETNPVRVRPSNSNREDRNQKYDLNLKITTNLNSSKRIVQEEPFKKDSNPMPIYSNNNNNNNNNSNNQARFNPNRKPQIGNHGNHQNLIYKNRNQGAYDEYYVPEDDITENNNSVGYSRPKKNYDNNRFASNDFNQQQPIPQPIRNNKTKTNVNDPLMTNNTYNDYLEYSGFTNNDYNQQNPNNSSSFQVKSQSYSNSNYKNHRNQNDHNDRAFKNQHQQYQQQEFQRNPVPNQHQQQNFYQPHQSFPNNNNRQQFTHMQHLQPQQSNNAHFNINYSNENNFMTRQNQQHFQQQNF